MKTTNETRAQAAISSQLPAIKQIADILAPQIDEIHRAPQMSKYYYSEYMALLGQFQQHQRKLVALAMMYYGCNPDGVKWAMRLM